MRLPAAANFYAFRAAEFTNNYPIRKLICKNYVQSISDVFGHSCIMNSPLNTLIIVDLSGNNSSKVFKKTSLPWVLPGKFVSTAPTKNWRTKSGTAGEAGMIPFHHFNNCCHSWEQIFWDTINCRRFQRMSKLQSGNNPFTFSNNICISRT
jgi:hypothetical protein